MDIIKGDGWQKSSTQVFWGEIAPCDHVVQIYEDDRAKFGETEDFCLFCAYPRSGFTQDVHDSMTNICGSHSKMITGLRQSKTEIFFKDIEQKKAG